jgi:hypothetical protein
MHGAASSTAYRVTGGAAKACCSTDMERFDKVETREEREVRRRVGAV